jgi:hypothetical protein
MQLVNTGEREVAVQTTIHEVATLHSLLNEVCHGLRPEYLWKSVADGHELACALLSRLHQEFGSRIEGQTRILNASRIGGPAAPESPVALLSLSREEFALLPKMIDNVIEALGTDEFSTRTGADIADARRLATEIRVILARG